MTIENEINTLASTIFNTFGSNKDDLVKLAGAVGVLQAEFIAEAMIKTEKNFDVLYKPMMKSIRDRATNIYEKTKREERAH